MVWRKAPPLGRSTLILKDDQLHTAWAWAGKSAVAMTKVHVC